MNVHKKMREWAECDGAECIRQALFGADPASAIRACGTRNGDVFFVTPDSRVVAMLVALDPDGQVQGLAREPS